MNKFKVGDTVVRINEGNGSRGARVGQEATVVRVESDMVHVTYPGCLVSYGTDSSEGWWPVNTEKKEAWQPTKPDRTLAILIAAGKITQADVDAARALQTKE